jgi:hypothetical protein
MSKTPDDGKIGAEGPGEMERRGLGAAGFGELGSMTRAERAEKYQRDMKPHFDKQLMERRGVQVKNHRENPRGNPNVDDKWDRWYVAEDWTDSGIYVGEGPCIKSVKPDPGALEKEEAERKAKLAKARAALSGVEGRLGVKPVVVAPAESVTEFPPSSPTVTELNGKLRDADGPVTEFRRGPKPSGKALTPAERAKAARDRKKGKPE